MNNLDDIPPLLSSRFEDALVYAARLHARQVRKGTGIPYISHLLAVSALVIQDGGSEDEAIAALLHDAVEDQGGMKTLEEIRRRFGEPVAAIVEGCTDATVQPKPPWRERKERYLAHLPQVPADVRRVSLADKVHNARSLLRDLRRDGDAVWGRFKGGKDGTLWYYHSLVKIFAENGSDYMTEELARVVDEIDSILSE
jgi:(p)ppGpp synthase/HD superfamily hydrolase